MLFMQVEAGECPAVTWGLVGDVQLQVHAMRTFKVQETRKIDVEGDLCRFRLELEVGSTIPSASPTWVRVQSDVRGRDAKGQMLRGLDSSHPSPFSILDLSRPCC